MLQIDRWKRILIIGICLLGLLYALPNAFYARVEAHNDAAAQIEASGVETPELIAARDAWPSWLPAGLVNLGLDLRGGAHLLGEVQVEQVYKSRMDALWPELRSALAEDRGTVGAIRRVDAPEGELRIEIGNPDQMARAVEIAREFSDPVTTLTGAGQQTLDITGSGATLSIGLSDAEKTVTDDRTIQQTLEIVRRRVDEVGTREPTIMRQGSDRVLIQVPGIGSAAELKELIGTTAQLTFNPVVGTTGDADAQAGVGQTVAPLIDQEGVYYILDGTPVVTGEDLVDALPATDQNGLPAVTFRFNPSGARAFGSYTSANVGQPFAIVLDNEVISAPVIRQAITTGSGQISGSMDFDQANQLAVLLRAGALPAEMTFLEERTVGPELGQDSIDAGKVAAGVGFVLVVALMIGSYGMFGIFATVALGFNMVLLFAILSAIGATLTLPGIAGIVLTIGMAVDANVLVFERIREELKTARGPARAIEAGYEKAMSAIVDANITTLIVAGILFVLGSGPVKGFAVTLTIGIVTSVFTALFVTRLITVMWFERARPKKIEV
ncbi:protein translocase subunit SecD [Paracoccus sp. 1_MG-2023]|uniref:protein translocase subunit SecD n=1 Tax=unclassified Paracoccus (in: a-proteobacteria) TaxID=2688777 RepID=UPI001C08AE81|nr:MULTISPECIES: protein translocase subunit SecD [unclassified Paracoccus (in: a-proteobacteria)]MBU2959005.1 protein translocase subunit SecD [Paracoccus sp. C2R09]MDO6668977.1 protein translocase subunit SecD [Paracoccus sp. 1_MG-2023]